MTQYLAGTPLSYIQAQPSMEFDVNNPADVLRSAQMQAEARAREALYAQQYPPGSTDLPGLRTYTQPGTPLGYTPPFQSYGTPGQTGQWATEQQRQQWQQYLNQLQQQQPSTPAPNWMSEATGLYGSTTTYGAPGTQPGPWGTSWGAPSPRANDLRTYAQQSQAPTAATFQPARARAQAFGRPVPAQPWGRAQQQRRGLLDAARQGRWRPPSIYNRGY